MTREPSQTDLDRRTFLGATGGLALAGNHAHPPVMWSEEYQADTVEMYFRTSQSIQRVAAMNFKGAFTRDRQPKLVAHRLRELWKVTKS